VVDATVDGRAYRMTVGRSGDAWRLALPESGLTATVVRERDAAWIAIDGEVYRCTASEETRDGGGARGFRSPHVTAPVPGKGLAGGAAAGREVAAGAPLVVLEAMKMETIASADAAARVVRVHVEPGAMVEPGQTLVDLEFL